ncbi:DUF3348 family protein [Ottowia thiooxydans]|uniref:DUF3348 family protein n=1 Tax=Ottowia thiooxydans TaxID=219182 RepID=UPI0004287BA5|nr:DUF3348 family protein [Ottowia thiooxydans]
MAKQKSVQTSLTGAALVRLLEALADSRVRVRDARTGFADGLVQWVGWADAIELSAALERPLADQALNEADSDERAEFGRLRTSLEQGLARAMAPTGHSVMEAEVGYGSLRKRYVMQQQTMEVAIGTLRERVRAVVAERSPEMARLAALDAVMDQVLSVQERRLLATVPGLLERHYRRLRDEYEGSGDWVKLFHQDMHTVLLAELDLRLQPVEGLLDALDED